jgi:gas vesicle protein
MTPEELRELMKKSLKENRIKFNGKYKDEINALLGFSREDIDKITPDTTDLEAYDQLITVVKEASAVNLDQIDLKQHIKDLGETAVQIAKKVESFKDIL